MPDSTAASGNPAHEPSQQTDIPVRFWEWWHTASIGLMVVFLGWMAMWRPWGLYASWLIVVAVLIAFIMITGLGITGVWRGAFIDERNMISLARFQMLAWSVLVLSAYGTLAATRAAGDEPLTALDVEIPQTVWMLMGISTTALVGAPLIRNKKKDPRLALDPDDQEQVLDNQRKGLAGHVRVEGQIVAKKSPQDASWSDLFIGEQVSDAAHLNLAKIQMFFFTVLLLITYGVSIASLLSKPDPTIPDALPDVGEGMLALFGISQGGYLVDKAVPGAPTK